MADKKQKELSGMEAPNIEELDKAADAYVKIRDRRMKLTEQECETKAKLVEAVLAHKDELATNGDGERTYRFDDQIIVVTEKLRVKVKTDHGGEEEEGD